MQLSILHKEQLVVAGKASWGEGLDSDFAIADALRAELWARRTVTRRPLCQRVAELMQPVRDIDPDAVRRVLVDLERDGDVTVGSGGLIAAAPIRLVDLGGGKYLVAGGPETSRLRELLGCEVVNRLGLRIVHGGNLELAVAQAGGIVLTPERWAGLDRVPPADAEWLELLDRELEHEPASADSLPPDCSDWRCYVPEGVTPSQRQRWKKPMEGGQSRLWRSRHDRGYWVNVWTGGQGPAAEGHVRLAADVACRAMFALDREAGNVVTMEVVAAGDVAVLEPGGMLPRAEYRYLVTLGERIEGTSLRYHFPKTAWPQVAAMLASRLGVEIHGEGTV